MKKIISSLPIIAMAGLVFFSSCKKDDDVAPGNAINLVGTTSIDGVNYLNQGGSLEGSTVTLSGSGMRSITTTVKRNGTVIDSGVDTTFSSDVSSYVFKADDESVPPYAGAYEFVLTGLDKNGKTITTATISLTVLGTASTSATLGDQANNASPSYYQVKTLSTVTSANFSTSTTDFNFVVLPTPVTSTSVANIISVDERSGSGFTTNTGSTRKFYIAETTTLNYTSSSAVDIYKAGTPSSKKATVSVGKTYLFVTNDGVRGLIKISSYASKPGQTDNTITFDLKVVDATGSFTAL